MKQRVTSYLLTLCIMMAGSALVAQAQTLPPGSSLPMGDRAMTNADGSSVTLSSLNGPSGLVVIFWSNGCTWVDKYEDRVLALSKQYGDQYGFALVNSNDPSAFPQETPAENQKRATSRKYGSLAYLSDEGSQLAKAFGAERTPHVFIFDASGTLVYTGALDDSPGDPNNVQNAYINGALDAVGSGSDVSTSQTKPFGCTLKPVG